MLFRKGALKWEKESIERNPAKKKVERKKSANARETAEKKDWRNFLSLA